MKLFCWGMGYTATALAGHLETQGWHIAGTRRASAATRDSPDLYTFDGTRPIEDAGTVLNGVTHMLISIPPGDSGDPVLRHHAALLGKCPALTWLGYLSTTGVYGDHGGNWINEETPPASTLNRSLRRLEAEQAWLALGRALHLPIHIFRLAGIYGPGRNTLEAVRAGSAQRIIKPGHVFSRIHVEDAARVLEASIADPRPGRIYNVCDDMPAPQAEVVEYACARLGLKPPPAIAFDRAELSPMAQSFYLANRRVSNRRIKDELGVVLRYPTYKDGIDALSARIEAS